MKTRLTLRLTPQQSDTLDWLVERKGDRHRDRDGVRKALEAERANRRRDRERHAALRASLHNARKTVQRVRQSRDRYRELAARAEAALLRTPPSGDLALLERRLRLALRKAGFELPPRLPPSAARPPPPQQRNAAG